MQFQKKYKLTAAIQAVQHALTDLHRYGRLHPLINGVEKLDTAINEWTDYKITERPFNWLPKQFLK